MPAVMKMSEAAKIQEAIEKVREMMCSPDKNPFREYWRKDNRYSLIAQLFHALSSENVHPYSLPDAWGRMMKANRAHLVIMLREAGAGHDPFGNAEWSSTPTQVWENLAQVQQLPTRDGADFSGLDFKWADLGLTKLSNVDLTGADLRWTSLMDVNLKGANLTGADLRWANLDGSDLSNANLTGADLRWATLAGANLSNADLRGAIIDGTNLDEADLTGANVTGVNLHSAYLDDDTKLDGAIGLEL